MQFGLLLQEIPYQQAVGLQRHWLAGQVQLACEQLELFTNILIMNRCLLDLHYLVQLELIIPRKAPELQQIKGLQLLVPLPASAVSFIPLGCCFSHRIIR